MPSNHEDHTKHKTDAQDNRQELVNPLLKFKDHQIWNIHEGKLPKQSTIAVDKGELWNASTANDEHWCVLSVVEKAFKKFPNAGLGLRLGQISSTKWLCGIDIDGLFIPNAIGLPLVEDIEAIPLDVMVRFKSYTEYSPSGKGCHILFLVTRETFDELEKRKVWINPHITPFSAGKGEEMSFARSHKFFTVTEHNLDNEDIREVDADTLEWFFTQAGPQYKQDAVRTLKSGQQERSEKFIDRSTAVLSYIVGWVQQQVAKGQKIVDLEAHNCFEELADMVPKSESDEAVLSWVVDKQTEGNAGERQLMRAFDRVISNTETYGLYDDDNPPFEPLEDDNDQQEQRKTRLEFIRGDEDKKGQRREYVVKGLFSRGDIVSIFGAPGAGKSVVAPYIGFRLIQEGNIFGRRTKTGPVFYVAAEDELGLLARRDALIKKYGVEASFIVVRGITDLRNKEDLTELLKAVKREEPAMVIIDTLARAFPGLEENDASAMGKVVAVAEKIANAHEKNCCVVLIHHDTKNAGGTPRGHSVLNGALDVGLLVTKGDSGIVNGKLTKNRNGSTEMEPEKHIAFTIESCDLGEDEDGDQVTAPVCCELNGEIPKRPKLSTSQKAALEIYEQLAGEGEKVERKVFLKACTNSSGVTSAETDRNKRSAASRVLKDLVQKKALETDKTHVWRYTETGFDDLDNTPK